MSFSLSRSRTTSKGVSDIQGRIGEYWHGNEPSHHVIYLYSYAASPGKPPSASTKS